MLCSTHAFSMVMFILIVTSYQYWNGASQFPKPVYKTVTFIYLYYFSPYSARVHKGVPPLERQKDKVLLCEKR